MIITAKKHHIHLIHLGTIPYQQAWDIQEKLLERNVTLKKNGQGEQTIHYLLICEHPSVYTLGKNGNPHHLLIPQEELKKRNIEFFNTNRGGDITFHGLGQLVAYPILDLEKISTDIGKYLRALEEVIILLLGRYGIYGERSANETGVWLDSLMVGKARKICAIGVKLSRWVSIHGLAFNVNPDLSYFDMIIPCGIREKSVTSLSKELGKDITLPDIIPQFLEHFQEHFDCTLENLDAQELIEQLKK